MKLSALPHSAPSEPACDSINDALRDLLKCVPPNSDDFDGEEILLDTDVDGSRYLLVRVPKPIQPASHLSPREREIARMVSKGCPNKVIADILSISPWTVCTHLRRIFGKLGVTSRAAMVAKMLESGNSRPAPGAR